MRVGQEIENRSIAAAAHIAEESVSRRVSTRHARVRAPLGWAGYGSINTSRLARHVNLYSCGA